VREVCGGGEERKGFGLSPVVFYACNLSFCWNKVFAILDQNNVSITGVINILESVGAAEASLNTSLGITHLLQPSG